MSMPDGTSVGGPTVAAELKRDMRHLTWAVIFCYVMSLLFFGIGFMFLRSYAQDNRELTIRTTAALCALKFDLGQRIKQGEDFLENNPEGIPGIAPELIQQQNDNTQRTLDALAAIQCPAVTGLDTP